jgi:ubiquinone biosynthesis protein Coq4
MNHRPLHAAKALVSLVRLIRDPNRLGEVFSLADHLIDAAPPGRADDIVDQIRRSSPEAARAFLDKPRVGRFDLTELAALPKGTLGQVFAEHMNANGLDPSALPSIPSRTEIEFFRAHLYETHDIWHAVTGFGTTVAEELGLQAFYLAQIPGGLPAAILGGSFFNTLLYKMDERDARMRAIVRGWLLGKRAQPFFGVRWGELWSVPMLEVRRRLGVEIARVEESMPDVELPRAA